MVQYFFTHQALYSGFGSYETEEFILSLHASTSGEQSVQSSGVPLKRAVGKTIKPKIVLAK